MNWKLLTLIKTLVILYAQLCDAQIVKVVTTWQRCTNGVCEKRSQQGTGTVVGKTPAGHSLVLGCKHNHIDPFYEAGRANYRQGTFESLTIDGKPGHVFKLSDKHDLSLMWVEDLGGEMLKISEANAEVGDELSIQGIDGGEKEVTGRPGKVDENGLLTAVAVQGNSGGPLISRTNVIYGVTTGYSPPRNPNRTVYVCAADICGFVRSVVPFGWVMWQPVDRPQPPPAVIEVPQDRTIPDRESAARVAALEKQVAALTDRVMALELAGGPPAVPKGEIPVVGERGPAGPAGRDGKPGRDGDRGPQGEAGRDGADATDGQILRQVQLWLTKNIDLVRGKDGRDGIDGQVGPAGLRGPAGPAGPPGRISVLATWDDGKVIADLQDLRDGDVVKIPFKKRITEPK